MEHFDEIFINFLTECRNNALDELQTEKNYAERIRAIADLRSKLEAIISPEAVELLEDIMEASIWVRGMEHNKVLLCGLTMSAEIQRRFDASTPEYQAFAKSILKTAIKK